MTEDEVHTVTMKPADENEDADQIPYLQLRQGYLVVTEAKEDFHELKEEKFPLQHIANEEAELGHHHSGRPIYSLSIAEPED